MKLIKINTDHYVVVDETIQPVNGYYYDSFINKIKNTNSAEYGEASHCWQITNSTIPIDVKITDEGIHLPDWSEVKALSPRVVKELIGEVDVEKKAEIIAKSLHDKSKHDDWSIYDQLVHEDKELIKLGYNQALEDNKEKKYTEEDMRRAYMVGKHGGVTQTYYEFDDYIQSIQPKTEWEVEIVDGKLKLKS